MNPPIKGMTKMPDDCEGAEPGFGWPGFLGCLYWAATVPEMRAQFTKDTGLRIEDMIKPRAPIEQMIDQSTGYEAKVIAAFADWVCVNVWGEEGAPEPEEDERQNVDQGGSK